MIKSIRKLSEESAHRFRVMNNLQKRTQSASSTMSATASYAANNSVERTSTIPCTYKKDFSTQVEHVGEAYRSILDATMNLSHDNVGSIPDSSRGFCVEMSIEQANAAAISGTFDKILLLLEHGEADYATCADGKVNDDLSLNSKGFGRALSVSGETAVYCYEGKDSGLSPDLFVVSPLQCAMESLLVAFPYYSPDTIYSKQWVCHGSCIDDGARTTPVENLERMFPGIDYSSAQDKSDFLSWLSTREERIIAVASTPFWVRSFCGSVATGNNSNLRAVGITF